MATAHVVANSLSRLGIGLTQFDKFATLNAELLSLPVGRTLGQDVKTPAEVLFNQPDKEEFFRALFNSLSEFYSALGDKADLEKFIEENIQYHDEPSGFVKSMFRKAGIVGARNANLRMYHFSFRTVDDQPGKLIRLLEPFNAEGANLTAIDSMPGLISEDERLQGVDPDRIVDFDIGIDPKTIDEDKEKRIKERLLEMGCTVSNHNS